MRHLLREARRTDIEVDSAGTGRWHVDEPPDPRAIATARRRGVTMTHLGRQFTRADFTRFDLILAVDVPVLRAVQGLVSDVDSRARARLLRNYEDGAGVGAEVPDPYYGDQAAFDEVFDICMAACRGLLATLPPPPA